MRPVIRDSLISGQPLYLLYSNSIWGPSALLALFSVALATQATGSVRLQVTGRPPTWIGSDDARAIRGSDARSAPAAPVSAPPAAPRSSCLRSRTGPVCR